MTIHYIPRAALLAATLAAAAYAQNLPATAPTSLPAPTALPAPNTLPSPIAATPAPEAPHRAEVTYAAGLIDVRADNSSLNQILRRIATLTSMKITGGVADQRVFGSYGPADPSTIIATLLDGTGVNILLRESTTPGVQSELIITQRQGGPTPPSPDNTMYAEAPAPPTPPTPQVMPDGRPFQQRIYQRTLEALPPRQDAPANNPGTGPVSQGNQGPVQPNNGPVGGPPSIPQPFNNVNGSAANSDPTASTLPTTNSLPIDAVATPSTTPSTAGIVDAPNPPPPGTTTSTANPGGVATPEQIYQQLKALQAAQQAATPATNPTTPK